MGGAPITPLCVAGGTDCGLDPRWRLQVALARAGVPALGGGDGATDSISDALPDTGSPSGDLATLAEQQASTLSRREVIETLRGILAEALTSPALARQLIDRVTAPRLDAVVSLAWRARTGAS